MPVSTLPMPPLESITTPVVSEGIAVSLEAPVPLTLPPLPPHPPPKLAPNNSSHAFIPYTERPLGSYIISPPPESLRRVAPYYATFNTHAKGRWLGRTLLDIFACEMRDRSFDYYRAAIEAGQIQINGAPAQPDSIVRNGDRISHLTHRHEPPVSATDVEIIAETADLLVINKPAGVPVHPAGRYYYNSVMEILRAKRGRNFIPRPCNRLDRLTSGIMFVGKSSAGTGVMTEQLRSRTVQKEYIARVVGEFPEGLVVCGQPILQISPKLGLNAVRANGKEARTLFKRLAYYPPSTRSRSPSPGFPNAAPAPAAPAPAAPAPTAATVATAPTKAKTPTSTRQGYSIVRCYPLTGRTHQLRVHLQYLGHPIANDPIYANQRVFGESLWSSTTQRDQWDPDEAVLARLERMGKQEVADAVAYYDEMLEGYCAKRAEKLTGELCAECGTELYSDPGEHELGIYLHARRYASLAQDDYKEDGDDDANGVIIYSGSNNEMGVKSASDDETLDVGVDTAAGVAHLSSTKRRKCWSYETGLPAWALPPPGALGPIHVTPETDLTTTELIHEKAILEREAMPKPQPGSMVGVVGVVSATEHIFATTGQSRNKIRRMQRLIEKRNAKLTRREKKLQAKQLYEEQSHLNIYHTPVASAVASASS